MFTYRLRAPKGRRLKGEFNPMRIRSTRTEDRIHGIVTVPSTLHKGFALQKIMLHVKKAPCELFAQSHEAVTK